MQHPRYTKIRLLERTLASFSSLSILLPFFIGDQTTRLLFTAAFFSVLIFYLLFVKRSRRNLSTLSILTLSLIALTTGLLGLFPDERSPLPWIILLPAVLALGVYVFSFRSTRGTSLDE
jgi:hypothetical protein